MFDEEKLSLMKGIAIHKSLIKLIVAIGFIGDGKVSREYLDRLLVND